MSEKPRERDVPDVVPGYGEADSEAASMNKAARNDQRRGSATASEAERAASRAAEKVPPATAGPVEHGTAEVDVKRKLAETAHRKTKEAARAKKP